MPESALLSSDQAAPGVQRDLANVIEAYAAWVREHGELAPFPAERAVAPTDVAIAVAAMLKAADINSFEIAALFNI